jgi:hypothetical protein
MRCNIALWDRGLRFLLAVLLLVYVIAGGPIWGWLGLYFLITAAWGLCPVYSFLRIKTIRTPPNPIKNSMGQSLKRS